MKLILKDSNNNTSFLIKLSFFAMIFGILGVLLGDLFAAMFGGVLATMISVRNKRFLVFASVIVLITLTADVFINGFVPIMTVEAVLIAIAITVLYEKGAEKSFVSSVLTVICVCFLVLSFVIIAMQETSLYTLQAVKGYYLDLYEQIKVQFVDMVNQSYSSLPSEYKNTVQVLSDEDIIALLDSAMSGLISYFVIFGFAVSGIALKMFCRVSSSISDNSSNVGGWAFKTSNLFCYFYMILMVAVMFINDGSVLSAAILNLYNIFTAVYLYIGLRFESAILRTKLSPIAVNLIIIGQFLFLFAIVFRVIPIIGAIFMILSNRAHQTPDNFSSDNQ